jgi:hypothetical protein
MQFVRNGPEVPERLLQAHEEGRVVFFCGAGISYPAGLPGFEGLACELTKQVGEPLDRAERALFEQGQFDRVLGPYEQRIQGGRTHVRKWLPEVLKPDLARPRALMTHLALLTLGRSKHDGLKLVTTNFDLLFEKAAEHYRQPSFAVYPDPPARPRWEGLVHLHGWMPANPSEDDLDRLVLSDGDFGQAYLIHGWASRFVAGLLRDYVLCFVGYSLNDPVVRYMTAAHALEGAKDKMFVFVPGNKSGMTTQPSERHLDHVTRIVYDEAKNHQALHRTLQMWASLHRHSRRKDQLSGKERIIARYAHKSPKESKPENDFVGRMLWALSDPSGLPAKRFAELNPVPSLDWLEPLSEKRFGHADLARFGVVPQPVVDDQPAFSLMRRPSPSGLAPWMCVADPGVCGSRWDAVMRHLAAWLTRHLGDSALLLWLVKRGGRLHDDFVSKIERRLDEIAKYEREDNMAELARIQKGAPQAIPSPPDAYSMAPAADRPGQVVASPPRSLPLARPFQPRRTYSQLAAGTAQHPDPARVAAGAVPPAIEWRRGRPAAVHQGSRRMGDRAFDR